MGMRKNTSRAAVVWLMGLLVVSLACMGQRDDDPPGDPDTGTPDASTPDTGETDSGDPDAGEQGTWLMSVADQSITGIFRNRVRIQSVETSAQGWVVVYADDSGSPGEVLGHSAVSAGVQVAVEVALSRDVTPDEQLYAALYEDLGVDGTFEVPGDDTAAPGDAGDPTKNGFVVSLPLDPEINVIDQHVGTTPPDGAVTLTRHNVTVAEVTAPEDGWVVVYDGSGGVPGDVIGHAPVAKGPADDIVVTVDRKLLHEDVLFVAVHQDLGTDGVFEFPGDDVPFNRPGTTDVLAESFTVWTPSISAGDQVAGFTAEATPDHTVLVTGVRSGQKGWVVLYSDTAGAPGLVIGHAPVGPDTATGADLVITAERDLVRGETLHAILHVDEGTPDTFEFPGVDLPRSDYGVMRPVQSTFVVDIPALEIASLYTATTIDAITVARVVSPGKAWLSARDENGDILGFVQVQPGETLDVVIPVTSRPLFEDETVTIDLNAENATVDQFDGSVPATFVRELSG